MIGMMEAVKRIYTPLNPVITPPQIKKGRHSQQTINKILQLHDKGKTAKFISEKLGIHPASAVYYVKKHVRGTPDKRILSEQETLDLIEMYEKNRDIKITARAFGVTCNTVRVKTRELRESLKRVQL